MTHQWFHTLSSMGDWSNDELRAVLTNTDYWVLGCYYPVITLNTLQHVKLTWLILRAFAVLHQFRFWTRQSACLCKRRACSKSKKKQPACHAFSYQISVFRGFEILKSENFPSKYCAYTLGLCSCSWYMACFACFQQHHAVNKCKLRWHIVLLTEPQRSFYVNYGNYYMKVK